MVRYRYVYWRGGGPYERGWWGTAWETLSRAGRAGPGRAEPGRSGPGRAEPGRSGPGKRGPTKHLTKASRATVPGSSVRKVEHMMEALPHEVQHHNQLGEAFSQQVQHAAPGPGVQHAAPRDRSSVALHGALGWNLITQLPRLRRPPCPWVHNQEMEALPHHRH